MMSSITVYCFKRCVIKIIVSLSDVCVRVCGTTCIYVKENVRIQANLHALMTVNAFDDA